MTYPRFDVNRRDNEDGTITYEVWDNNLKTYSRIMAVSDEDDYDPVDGAEPWAAKKTADLVAKALNSLAEKETIP